MKKFAKDHINELKLGIILGFLFVIYSFVNNFFNLNASQVSFLNNYLLFIIISFFVFSGYTGYKTRRRDSVIFALFVGVVSWFISIIFTFIFTTLFLENIRHNSVMIENFKRSGSNDMNLFIFQDAARGSFLGLVATLILSSLLGNFGGFLATKFKKKVKQNTY